MSRLKPPFICCRAAVNAFLRAVWLGRPLQAAWLAAASGAVRAVRPAEAVSAIGAMATVAAKRLRTVLMGLFSGSQLEEGLTASSTLAVVSGRAASAKSDLLAKTRRLPRENWRSEVFCGML